jgi:hypothetical protein
VREKLNSNPTLQIALIGILALGAAYFLLLGGGGGGESKGTAATAEAPSTAGTSTPAAATPEGEAVAAEAGTTAPSAGIPADASTMPTPPLPAPVLRAYKSSKTVVLLVVRGGGIDDRYVAQWVHILPLLKNLKLLKSLKVFVVRAKHIARYSAITLGVDVERVPALIVLRPRRLSHDTLQATVSYGYQSPQSVVQAVIDASYKGPEPTYHPN